MYFSLRLFGSGYPQLFYLKDAVLGILVVAMRYCEIIFLRDRILSKKKCFESHPKFFKLKNRILIFFFFLA